jgi:hypothetical protein
LCTSWCVICILVTTESVIMCMYCTSISESYQLSVSASNNICHLFWNGLTEWNIWWTLPCHRVELLMLCTKKKIITWQSWFLTQSKIIVTTAYTTMYNFHTLFNLFSNMCYLCFLDMVYWWQKMKHGHNYTRMNNDGVRCRWSQIQGGHCCPLTPTRWVQHLVALCRMTVIILL